MSHQEITPVEIVDNTVCVYVGIGSACGSPKSSIAARSALS